MQFDDASDRIISNIDVLWLKGNRSALASRV
jgi:hypothetical protein